MTLQQIPSGEPSLHWESIGSKGMCRRGARSKDCGSEGTGSCISSQRVSTCSATHMEAEKMSVCMSHLVGLQLQQAFQQHMEGNDHHESQLAMRIPALQFIQWVEICS